VIILHLDIDIHNYYEHLVAEYITEHNFSDKYEQEFCSDVCCLALTKLPSKYIRHDVDMAFFLSSSDRKTMVDEVAAAMTSALTFLFTEGQR